MVSKFWGKGTQRYGVNLERNHGRMFSKGRERHELEEQKKEGILSQGNKNGHMISHWGGNTMVYGGSNAVPGLWIAWKPVGSQLPCQNCNYLETIMLWEVKTIWRGPKRREKDNTHKEHLGAKCKGRNLWGSVFSSYPRYQADIKNIKDESFLGTLAPYH